MPTRKVLSISGGIALIAFMLIFAHGTVWLNERIPSVDMQGFIDLLFEIDEIFFIVGAALIASNLLGIVVLSDSFFGRFIPRQIEPAADFILTWLVRIIAVTHIAPVLGTDVSHIFAGLGLFGAGFVLASQQTAQNIIGFIAIVTNAPFLLGDNIEIAERKGVVKEIGAFYTRLETAAGETLSVPNSLFVSGITAKQAPPESESASGEG